MAPKNETPVEFLSRLGSALNYEYGNILDQLPSVEAVIDYFKLWDVYDTEFLAGIAEALEEGDDPKPYLDFVAKYNLAWNTNVGPQAVDSDKA